MNPAAMDTDKLEEICGRYSVQRLDLFGSASAGRSRREASDLDFLVEFLPVPINAYADVYFGLLEALEEHFGRPVDLVVASSIKNPYLLQSIEATKSPVYEAHVRLNENQRTCT